MVDFRMKLTDFLENVGRSVAYYPGLKKLTGSATATILLCQFIYWRGKESDPEGWLFKTADELEGETGLSYNEQRTARKSLIEAGFLEENYARLDHQMRFRLNLDNINSKWASLQPAVRELDNPQMANCASSNSLNGTSETTTENTTTREVSFRDATWDLMHGKDVQPTERDIQADAVHNVAVRLSAGLRRGEFPESLKAQSIYKWILEREKQGQSLDRFIAWAMDGKRAEYSFVYHKDPALIKRDWMQVFDAPKKQTADRVPQTLRRDG